MREPLRVQTIDRASGRVDDDRSETRRANLVLVQPGTTFSTDVATRSAVGPTSGPYRRFGKRLIDIVGSALVITVAAPLLLIVWAALRVTLGGGVVLRQERVGRDGQTFGLFKFRTMELDRRARDTSNVIYSGTDRRECHKTTADPRHTPLGRIVRKFSLDELPQLFNVLKGDMSLVGPRPELASRASDAFVAHHRHDVRPGLTGPFQVSELRSAGDLAAGLSIDGNYADTVSLRNDVGFLFKTIGVLVRGTGN